MLGMIFEIAREVCLIRLGSESWQQIEDQAGLAEHYNTYETYDDADFAELVLALSDVLGRTVPVTWFDLGAYVLDGLIRRHPHEVSTQTGSIDFLRYTNREVHGEFRRAHGATPPLFSFEELPSGKTRLVYSSDRNIHHFMEGMLSALGKYFNEQIILSRPNIDLPGNATAFDLKIVKKPAFPRIRVGTGA